MDALPVETFIHFFKRHRKFSYVTKSKKIVKVLKRAIITYINIDVQYGNIGNT